MNRKNSILRQFLFPIVAILVCLTALIITSVIYTFTSSYMTEINAQNANEAEYIAEAVTNFMDGAYNLSEELANNSDIRSMETERQHAVLASVVARNPYMETIYAQNLDGVQTGRSSGKLGNRRDRWWFKQLLETKKPFISNSYYSIATNMPCASIFFPIQNENKIIGNMGVDLKLDYLQSLIGRFTDSEKERFSFIIDGAGVVMAHPDSRYIEELYNYKTLTHTVSVKDENGNVVREGNNIVTKQEPFEADSRLTDAIEKLLSGESGTALVNMNDVESFVAWTSVKLKGESANWGVITVQSEKSAFFMMHKIVRIMLIIALAALIVSIIIVVAITRKITKPITEIRDTIRATTNEISSGTNGRTRKISIKNRDEIGDVADGFNIFSEKLDKMMSQIRIAKEKDRKTGQQLLSEVQNLAVSTKETAATSQDSAAAVKEIVATMEDSNLLSENISTKIKDVSSVANTTSSDVTDGVAQIDQNVQQLHAIFDANQQTIEGIKTLSEKIESIWDIVTLINNVADQAKIIAFNAELEASTAGEAGKSFRIVANEIRRLSDGIIDGTREIKEKINEIQHSSDTLIIASESGTEKINAGYENARELEEKFASIKKSAEITATSAGDIAEIIQQQAIASEQILIALKEISAGVENFTVATDNISGAVENVRKISEDLNNASWNE